MTHYSQSNFMQRACAWVAHHTGGTSACSDAMQQRQSIEAVAVWRTKLAVSLLLLVAAAPVLAQQLEWSRGFDDVAQRVVVLTTRAHGAFIYHVGEIGKYPKTDAYVRKHDLQGRVIWTRRLPFEGSSSNGAYEVAIDDTGAYVTGYRYSDTGQQLSWLARLDLQTGNPVWVKTPESPQLGAIAVHSSGIYIGGYERDATTGLLLKFDRRGSLIWSKPVATDSTGIAQIVVFKDSLYVRHPYDPRIRRLDLEGAELSRFPANDDGGVDAMAVDASGVYALSRVYRAYKYTHDGRLQWQRRLPTVAGLTSLALDATGIYAVGTHGIQSLEGCCKRVTTAVKLAASGHLLWSYESESESESESLGFGISVRDSIVYLTSYERLPSGALSTIFDRLTQDLPPQAQPVSDLNGDENPELAVLVHDSRSASVSVVVKSAGTGAQVGRISFDSNYWPQRLLKLPDLNGNGTEELAVLGVHRTSGATSLEVRDSRTGLRVSRVPFAANVTPTDLVSLADVNASGSADVALKAWSNDASAETPPFVEVRDGLTGTLIQTLRPELDFSDQLLVLPDRNGNGSPELALAQRDAGVVKIFDSASGQRLQDVIGAYDPSEAYSEISFATLPDSNANDVSEIVLLRQLHRGNQTISLRVFDGASPPRNVGFGPGGVARELLRLPDIDGDRYPEIAVLKTDTRVGRNVIQVRDGRRGALIGNQAYVSAGFTHRGLSALQDVNGNGSPEIAVLQQRTSDRKTFALIKDARTGALLRSIAY
jgi:outer membrane protein assembly factor BamB